MMQKEVCEFLSVIERKANKPTGLKEEVSLLVSSSAFKKYHSEGVSYRERLHLQLNDILRHQDWLKIEFKPAGFDDHEFLKRVWVKSTSSMLNFMGEAVLSEVIGTSIANVLAEKIVLPLHLLDLESLLTDSWGLGKQFYGCSHDASNRLIDGLKVASFLYQNQNDALSIDYRTLSVRLFDDSKRIESLISLVARLLKPDTPDLDDDKPKCILEYWGLSRFPPLFCIKGDLQIITPAGNLDVSQAWPFLALPPDGIVRTELHKQPLYILFIENKTTFERYCREVSDMGLVLYTNGFPSRQWQKIFKQIDGQVFTETPIFHWGDVDVGGYKIFDFMSGLLQKPIKAYKMDCFIEDSSDKGIKVDDMLAIINKSTRVGAWDESIVNGLHHLLGGAIKRIEQEHLDVEPPMSADS